jgi:hypothetical protein
MMPGVVARARAIVSILMLAFGGHVERPDRRLAGGAPP